MRCRLMREKRALASDNQDLTRFGAGGGGTAFDLQTGWGELGLTCSSELTPTPGLTRDSIAHVSERVLTMSFVDWGSPRVTPSAEARKVSLRASALAGGGTALDL